MKSYDLNAEVLTHLGHTMRRTSRFARTEPIALRIDTVLCHNKLSYLSEI